MNICSTPYTDSYTFAIVSKKMFNDYVEMHDLILNILKA